MPAEANNSWAQGPTQADVPEDIHACSRKLNTESGVHYFPKERSASYSEQLLQQNGCLKTQTRSGVQGSVTTCQLCTYASIGWCSTPPFTGLHDAGYCDVLQCNTTAAQPVCHKL